MNSGNSYYYNNDIYTRILDNYGDLGLTEAQALNILNLHGYEYYDTETERFEYPNMSREMNENTHEFPVIHN